MDLGDQKEWITIINGGEGVMLPMTNMGYAGVGLQSNAIQFQRAIPNIVERSMNVMQCVPSSTLLKIQSHSQSEDDNDPLTLEEIEDAKRGISDLECGRFVELPAEMSTEDMLDYFRSLR
jgi:hypothetical protein